MEPLTASARLGIAIASTSVVILIIGFLAGVLVYHCISKHQSQSSKPEPCSSQQLQAVSSSSSLPQTGPEYEKVMEMKENMAYRPKTDWLKWEQIKPMQHWFDIAVYIAATHCLLMVFAGYEKSQEHTITFLFFVSHTQLRLDRTIASKLVGTAFKSSLTSTWTAHTVADH